MLKPFVTILAALGVQLLWARCGAAQPVTAKDAQALAQSIGTGAAKGDLSALEAAIDDAEIFNRTVKGLTLKPETRAGMSQGASIAAGLAKTIQAQVRQGGSYRLVRVGTRDGEPRPLFRLISAQGLNYHEMHLFRDARGKVRIGDMFVFVVGETLSQNLRAAFLPFLSKDGGVRLTAQQKELAGSAETLGEIRQLLAAGKNAEASALYEKLPDSVRETKSVGLIGVMISSSLGPERYAAAIDAYRAQFPEAAEVDLVTIDALFLRKDFDGALAAVERLDKRLGGDPYLDLFRGNVQSAKGDPDRARALFRRALKAEPGVPAVYFPLIELELGAGGFDEVAALMTLAERSAGVRWSDLEKEPAFAGFVKSPAYAKWKSRGANAPAPPAAAKTASPPKKAGAKSAPATTAPPKDAPAKKAPAKPAPAKTPPAKDAPAKPAAK